MRSLLGHWALLHGRVCPNELRHRLRGLELDSHGVAAPAAHTRWMAPLVEHEGGWMPRGTCREPLHGLHLVRPRERGGWSRWIEQIFHIHSRWRRYPVDEHHRGAANLSAENSEAKELAKTILKRTDKKAHFDACAAEHPLRSPKHGSRWTEAWHVLHAHDSAFSSLESLRGRFLQSSTGTAAVNGCARPALYPPSTDTPLCTPKRPNNQNPIEPFPFSVLRRRAPAGRPRST